MQNSPHVPGVARLRLRSIPHVRATLRRHAWVLPCDRNYRWVSPDEYQKVTLTPFPAFGMNLRRPHPGRRRGPENSTGATPMSGNPRRWQTLAVLACSVVLPAIAALPPRSPDNLAKSAALIITGTVTDSSHSTEGRIFYRDH